MTDLSKQFNQIYDKNNNLLWDDKEILNSLSNVHIKRNHVKDKYNFDDNFKQTIDKKVKDILNNIDASNLQDSCQSLNSPLSLNEVKSAINNLNGNGSPGPPTSNQKDPGLPPIILKLGIDIISPYFHHLLTNLW